MAVELKKEIKKVTTKKEVIVKGTKRTRKMSGDIKNVNRKQ
jgi:hypothetical protein